MQQVMLISRSSLLAKAFPTRNSESVDFSTTFDMTQTPPSGDGVLLLAKQGEYVAQSVILFPYAEGQPGNQFNMRVYGWFAQLTPDLSQVPAMWVPSMLAELNCTLCARHGPANPGSGYPLTQSELMCDTITLNQGRVCPPGSETGEINSTGPGTNLIAFAKIDLAGCRILQFDFDQVDPVNMNCLYAIA